MPTHFPYWGRIQIFPPILQNLFQELNGLTGKADKNCYFVDIFRLVEKKIFSSSTRKAGKIAVLLSFSIQLIRENSKRNVIFSVSRNLSVFFSKKATPRYQHTNIYLLSFLVFETLKAFFDFHGYLSKETHYQRLFFRGFHFRELTIFDRQLQPKQYWEVRIWHSNRYRLVGRLHRIDNEWRENSNYPPICLSQCDTKRYEALITSIHINFLLPSNMGLQVL